MTTEGTGETGNQTPRYVRSDDLDEEARRWLAERAVERVGLDGEPVFDLRDVYPDLDEAE